MSLILILRYLQNRLYFCTAPKSTCELHFGGGPARAAARRRRRPPSRPPRARRPRAARAPRAAGTTYAGQSRRQPSLAATTQLLYLQPRGERVLDQAFTIYRDRSASLCLYTIVTWPEPGRRLKHVESSVLPLLLLLFISL